MKKVKIFNSILLGSVGISIPTMLLSSCSHSRDGIELVKGDKEILYTRKTNSVALLFKAKEVNDVSSLRVKICDIVISGAEAKPVDGLIKYRYDSAGNIVVRVYPQVFKQQWPDTEKIEFSLNFINKDTKLDQVMSGFSLKLVDTTAEYDLFDTTGVMATEAHQASSSNVYAYTCKFPEDEANASKLVHIFDYFSFLQDDDSLVPISYVNITKDGEALVEGSDFTLEDNKTYIKLNTTPTKGETYVFETVFSGDGTGRFINACRNTSLDMAEGVVSGFKTETEHPAYTDAVITEEFANGKIAFYPHTTAIADGAFNEQIAPRKISSITGGNYDTISFEYCQNCTLIGESAFAETQIPNIILPTSGLKTIGRLAFEKSAICRDSEELELPDGLLEVGAGAFHACEFIKELTIPNTCTTIGSGAFADTVNMELIDFSSWDNVPSTQSTDIFYKCGAIELHKTTKGKIKIGDEQFQTTWKQWLIGQGMDFDYWEIEGGQ